MPRTDRSDDVAKLRSDVEEIRRDLAAIAKSVGTLGSSRVEELGEQVRSGAASAEERLAREITERPLASVLVAFGAGLVMSALLDSGR